MLRGLKSYLLYSLGFFLVLEIMIAAAIYWWPTFEDNAQNIINIASRIPVLGGLATTVKEKGVSAYVYGQQYFKGCAALGTAACVLFAAPAVAGEVHRGTMEMWLARPVSRFRLFTERWVGGFVAIAAPVVLSSISIAWMLPWVDDSMPVADLALTSLHMVLFLAPIYAATFAWSSFGSEPMRISFVMLFLSVLAFAMYLVEAVTNYTPYRIVDIRVFLDIEKAGQLDWRYYVPLTAATLAGYVVGLRSFLRRTP